MKRNYSFTESIDILKDTLNRMRLLTRESDIYIRALEKEINTLEKRLRELEFLREGFFPNEKDKDKFSLIGKLPTVLLSKKYFPDNKALIDFAKTSLELPISIRRKRSRREIIGIIITEVANLDPRKISDFRKVLDKVLSKRPSTRESFFKEWERAIKSISFRR